MDPEPTTVRHEVVSVVCCAGLALVGAWVLVLVAGTVAIFAVLIVAGLYVPLRCHRLAETRAPVARGAVRSLRHPAASRSGGAVVGPR